MRQARVDKILDGESSLARKVYEAVPISEPWSIKQIVAELRRKQTSNSLSTIQGSLNALASRNLIKEPSSGMFIRAKVSTPTPTPQLEVPKPVNLKAVDKKPSNPIDELGELSQQARDLASHMTSLATALDNVAIKIDDFMQEQDAESAKLKQLKALLQDLN